jgi:hypothetical protein
LLLKRGANQYLFAYQALQNHEDQNYNLQAENIGQAQLILAKICKIYPLSDEKISNKLKSLFNRIKLLAKIKKEQNLFNNSPDLRILQKLKKSFEDLRNLNLTTLEEKCQKETLDNIEKMEQGEGVNSLRIINEKQMSIKSFIYQEKQESVERVEKEDVHFQKQLLFLSGFFLIIFVIN